MGPRRAAAQDNALHRPHFRLELELRGGIANPAGAPGLRLGPGVSGAALARVSSATSFGFVAEYHHFGWTAESYSGFRSPNEDVRVLLAGVAWRTYFQDEGNWDPYFQLVLAKTSVQSSVAGGQCSGGDGAMLQLAAGWDTYVARWLKLGPVVAVGVGGASRQVCTEVWIENDPPAQPGAIPQGAVRVGGMFVLGDPGRR